MPVIAAGPGRTLLKDQIYEKIKGRILSEEFPPQSFLSERKLSAQFNVSKTPIRNALERLAGEGLVKISPQQGVVVQELSIREVVDLFETRAALESHVVNAVAGKLTAEQKQRMEENLAAQKQAADENNIPESIRIDGEFHILLAECLGNTEITRIMRQSRDKIHRVILRILSDKPERQFSSYDEHAGVYRAVAQGKAELAVKRIKDHLEYGKQKLLSR